MSDVSSYHGQPILKEPTWTWEIPCYFYVGGMAGASAGLAYLSELSGNEVLARRAWAAAMLGIGVSPALLTSDLGRPLRFLNMLRMFKVTSPMSVGSWILTASGATTALAAASVWTGRFPRAGKAARPAAAAFGLPLCTYTAALIANTAVPVWHESRRWLPFVFGAGAALSAGAANVIATSPEHARPARRLALASAALEVGLKELMERRLGEQGEPYREGAASKFGRLGQLCISTGASLLAARGGRSRGAAVAGGALLSAGALSARWSVYKAGFQSAANPKYVVRPQRSGIERGERPGAARQESYARDPERALGSPATAPLELSAS
ncbi:MAG: NrfD/PsrC family molybdoenzyme membrane anchor subunit [Solirubrobacteraceae bacterium]